MVQLAEYYGLLLNAFPLAHLPLPVRAPAENPQTHYFTTIGQLVVSTNSFLKSVTALKQPCHTIDTLTSRPSPLKTARATIN